MASCSSLLTPCCVLLLFVARPRGGGLVHVPFGCVGGGANEFSNQAQAAVYLFSTQLGLRSGSLYVNGKMLDLEGPTFNAFQVFGYRGLLPPFSSSAGRYWARNKRSAAAARLFLLLSQRISRIFVIGLQGQ